MDIIKLKDRQDISGDMKLSRIYSQFEELLSEFEKKKLPQNIIESINQKVQEINASSLTGNELRKFVKQKQTKILKKLEKELKIVPKSYYLNMWLTLGLSVFGIPLGAAFGISMGNMGLLGIGLPIGMGIGIVVGLNMDKKAANEGRQLDIEIKY